MITGLRPRTALASVMEDVHYEEIETKEYVEELHKSLTDIYDKVKKAQEVRAEAAQATCNVEPADCRLERWCC